MPLILSAACKREELVFSSGLELQFIYFARNDTLLNAPSGSKRSICLMRGDGRAVVDLSRHPPGGYGPSHPGFDSNPAVSPDGRYVAFQADRDGNDEIYRMDPDGASVINLTRSPGIDQEYRWAPGGLAIAFTRFDSGAFRIFVMNNDGTGQKGLTCSGFDSRYPDWSPDGARIVFSQRAVAVSGPYMQLRIVDADGRNETSLTDSTESALFPRWSPDGGRVYYLVAGTGMAYRDVYRPGHATLPGVFPNDIAFSPGGDRLVTTGLRILDRDLNISPLLTTAGSMPCWSRDGNWIVFRRSAPGGTDCLFVVRPDGRDEQQITESRFGDLHPVWKP